MDKKKEYYRKLFRHITEMFPNGDWVETMKRLIWRGHPNEDEKAASHEEFNTILYEIIEEYGNEKQLTTSQLLDLLF